MHETRAARRLAPGGAEDLAHGAPERLQDEEHFFDVTLPRVRVAVVVEAAIAETVLKHP